MKTSKLLLPYGFKCAGLWILAVAVVLLLVYSIVPDGVLCSSWNDFRTLFGLERISVENFPFTGGFSADSDLVNSFIWVLLVVGGVFIGFSRNKSDMDLLSRRIIVELEGEEGLEHLDEYADANTERGRRMREVIAEKMGFETLVFQKLDGVVEAIGLPSCKLCKYCWTGRDD